MSVATITVVDFADWFGVTPRTVQTDIKSGLLPEATKGVLPLEASVRAYAAHLRGGRSAKAGLDAEKLRNLKLDAETKERTKKKDEGEWLESAVFLSKIEEHIGEIRQAVKTVLLLEQPATLSGRADADIRELNQKTYTALCRRMQNAAGKLRPEPVAEKAEAASA